MEDTATAARREGRVSAEEPAASTIWAELGTAAAGRIPRSIALPRLCPDATDHGGDGRITRDAKLLNVQQALGLFDVSVDSTPAASTIIFAEVLACIGGF